jgi:hypothetical protein
MNLEALKTRMIYLIFLIIGLYFLKPDFIFKPDGTPREYGVGYDSEGYHKTFYTFQVVIVIMTAIIYATF